MSIGSSAAPSSDMPDGKQVYVALGSNLGKRDAHLDAACEALADLCVNGSSLKSSSRIETRAVVPADRAGENQPDYLNAVVSFRTELEPILLLDALQSIERERGREREGIPHWSARPLDLDLLLYGEQRVCEPRLTVPHARLLERRFVLQPLAELAPDLVIPGASVTVAEALAALDSSTNSS